MIPEIEERFTSLENCQPFQLANYSGVYFLCQGTTVVCLGKIPEIEQR
jgi:hypothetical protein